MKNLIRIFIIIISTTYTYSQSYENRKFIIAGESSFEGYRSIKLKTIALEFENGWNISIDLDSDDTTDIEITYSWDGGNNRDGETYVYSISPYVQIAHSIDYENYIDTIFPITYTNSDGLTSKYGPNYPIEDINWVYSFKLNDTIDSDNLWTNDNCLEDYWFTRDAAMNSWNYSSLGDNCYIGIRKTTGKDTIYGWIDSGFKTCVLKNYSASYTAMDKTVIDDKILIYPNPVLSKFTILSSQDISILNCSVIDLSGRILRQFTLTGNNREVDISNLGKGTYIFMYKINSNKRGIKMLVKE